MRNWFEQLRRRCSAPRAVRPLGRYRYVRLRWRMLFAVIDGIGHRLRWLLARPASERRAPQKILIVQLDHLGDAILSTGLLRGLKAAYPQARIDVLASAANAELFASLPEVERVFVAHVTRFAGARMLAWVAATISWGHRLRPQRYDLAIDPRGDFPSAVILWLCGAPTRLGWGCGGGGFLLTHMPEYVWGRHEVLSRQALLDQLDIDPPPGELAWPPCIPIPAMHEKHTERAERVVLHVGAGTAAKRWPIQHWRELACRLVVERNPEIVLVGSAVDGEEIGDLPGVQNLCGQLTLPELTAVVADADLFIGADSGPAHLANAVGTPVIVLFSGTNRAEQWRPWGEGVRVMQHETACSPCHRHRCPLSDHPCMHGLSAATVAAAALNALSESLERSTLEGVAR